MWFEIYNSILLASLNDDTKLSYTVLSFWLVLSVLGFGAGLVMSFISNLFLSTTK